MSASASDVSSAAVMVMASARKKLSGNASDGDQRQKHHYRRDGGIDQRRGDLVQRLAHRFDARLAGVAVHDDVFNDDDGVVDDQANGRREAAESHQVEALAHDPQSIGS